MALNSIAGSGPGELRLTRARKKLEQAAISDLAGLTPAQVGQRLAFCNKALDDIARVRVGTDRGRLLDLMPATAGFAEIESVTEPQPHDTQEQVQTRDDFRDTYIEARRAATRASWGKAVDQVLPLDHGVLVEGPGRLLIQQGTNVFRALEGIHGESFRIEDGQPVREAAALTSVGPMPVSFLDRGAVNYKALNLLNLESLMLDGPGEMAAPGDVFNDINHGNPWGPRSVLKWDEFPGRQHYLGGGLFKPGENQADAPNYRQLPGYPVHGVAQPSRAGLKAIFAKVVREHGKQAPVFWMNTRAEAVLYIDGKPYNVREISSFLNLPYREGASGEELERLEDELKELLVKRGSVPVQAENGVVTDVPIDAEKIRTTREEMTLAAAEAGVVLDYHRIPVRDESAPTPQELDLMHNEVKRFHQHHPSDKAQYIVNCHMGKGRTTTGMIAIALTLDSLHPHKGRSAAGQQRTEELEGRANQVVNLLEAIQVNDAELEAAREKLAQLQTALLPDEDQIRECEASIIEKERRAREYRQRQLELEMYSLYLAGPQNITFTEWVKLPEQQTALAARRQRLEEQVQRMKAEQQKLSPSHASILSKAYWSRIGSAA